VPEKIVFPSLYFESVVSLGFKSRRVATLVLFALAIAESVSPDLTTCGALVGAAVGFGVGAGVP
jgi:hypothetical protein